MNAWASTVQQIQVAVDSQRYAGVLTSHQAIALKLREEGKTEHEIARYFGISPSAAHLLLERAKRRLHAMTLLKAGHDVKEIARKMRVSMNAAVRLVARME